MLSKNQEAMGEIFAEILDAATGVDLLAALYEMKNFVENLDLSEAKEIFASYKESWELSEFLTRNTMMVERGECDSAMFTIRKDFENDSSQHIHWLYTFKTQEDVDKHYNEMEGIVT